MEKFTRKLHKRWSGTFSIRCMDSIPAPTGRTLKDYAQDHFDLGAVLNEFSLDESDEMASAIEKTGEGVDATSPPPNW